MIEVSFEDLVFASAQLLVNLENTPFPPNPTLSIVGAAQQDILGDLHGVSPTFAAELRQAYDNLPRQIYETAMFQGKSALLEIAFNRDPQIGPTKEFMFHLLGQSNEGRYSL